MGWLVCGPFPYASEPAMRERPDTHTFNAVQPRYAASLQTTLHPPEGAFPRRRGYGDAVAVAHWFNQGKRW